MNRDKRHAYIQTARAIWASDDLEIDDKPKVSPSEGGAWVAAWVWVADAERYEVKQDGELFTIWDCTHNEPHDVNTQFGDAETAQAEADKLNRGDK